jgi:hypothetical protein
VTRTSIFACPDARAAQWQLGPLPPPAGRVTLIGWNNAAEQTDAGVPEDIARVLANAFTAVARVTFPCSCVDANTSAPGGWSPSDGDMLRTLTTGFAARIAAKLNGTPAEITLVSTRRADSAIRAFDDGAFPWWMQGQVMLLSQPDAPPPDVDAKSLLALFEDAWTTHAASLGRGIQGVVRPGVDGDVAGLLSLSDAFERDALAALEHETRRAGFEWAVMAEKAFAVK